MLKFARDMRYIVVLNSPHSQFTLHMAAGSLALQDKLSVGILSENVALAAVRYDHYVNQYPKLSTLVDPRPMTFLHHAALSPEDEER